MIITAPVTDYIPASILTTDGDLVVRHSGVIRDAGSYIKGSIKASTGTGMNLANWLSSGLLNQYLKGKGLSEDSVFEPLALRDTGIFIGDFARSLAGDLVIPDIGFKTSVAILFSHDGITTNLNSSYGFDNGIVASCIFTHTNNTEHAHSSVHSIKTMRNVDNGISGKISAIGDTSVTFTFVLVGTCNVHTVYLFLP